MIIFLQGSFQNGPSPTNVLKLNVNAALFGGIATLAVIARDDSGSILQCWTKRCYTIDLCFVEAAALLCALELARDNHFPKIMVEGDAKICIEAISASSNTIPWKIFSIVANIKFLALAFSACSFCWVHRDANGVAHALAKYASSQPLCFSCTGSNLPPSMSKAWIRNLSALSS